MSLTGPGATSTVLRDAVLVHQLLVGALHQVAPHAPCPAALRVRRRWLRWHDHDVVVFRSLTGRTVCTRCSGSEWNWLRGALATIDRDYGFFNLVHHHIGDTHIVHHLFSTMPHYHAQEATEAIKPVLGKYYNLDTSPISTSLWQALKFCRYVEAEKAPPPNSVDGVYWFNVPTSTK